MNIIKTRNREFEAQKPLQPLVASDKDADADGYVYFPVSPGDEIVYA